MQPEFETREQYENYKAMLLHRDMMRAIEPFIKAKCDAMALMMPKILVIQGEPFAQVEYSQEDQAIMAQFDNAIKSIVEYFKKMAPEHLAPPRSKP